MTDKPMNALDAAKLFVLAHPNHGNAVQVIQMIDEARAALSATQGVPDIVIKALRECQFIANINNFSNMHKKLLKDALASISQAPTAAPDAWQGIMKRLVIAGRVTGGTAGRDEKLCAALDDAEKLLAGTVQ